MKLKKLFFSTATLCATSAMVFGAMTPLRQAIAQELLQPNFVTIVIDDMGYSDLGVFGGEVQTPNLDELANDGIILTNFYAASSSSPSRAMLFSGKDNHVSGMGDMLENMQRDPRVEQTGQPGYEGVLSLDIPVFPELLQGDGYYTMMTGKWHMGGAHPGEEAYYAVNRGFTDTRSLLLGGGDIDFLVQADGHFVSETIAEASDQGRAHLYNDSGLETDFSMIPPLTHSTDHFTDEAIRMLDNWNPNQPFYLNMSYLAPHMPYQAPKWLIDKYVDTYSVGWDVIREQRFNRLKEDGYIPSHVTLAERPADVRAWDDLSDRERQFEARRMAIYAAELDLLDQNIGRLIQELKDRGAYDNTVFFVYSDNGPGNQAFGGPPEGLVDHNNIDVDGLFDDEFQQLLADLGGATSYINQTPGWASVAGTPFSDYKGDTFDGGIRGAAFVHYPQARATGAKTNCLYSVMDIAPTMLDMADIQYPIEYNGEPNTPMDGISMAGLFEGNLVCDPERWIGFELRGIKGLRKGDWKLSQGHNLGNIVGLYNVWDDPYELHNLSAEMPELYQEMWGLYEQYAEENGVVEINNLSLPDLTDPAIAGAKIRGGSSSVNLTGRTGFFLQEASFNLMDEISIAGEIRPASEHQGQPGKIFARLSYTPAGSAKASDFWVTADGLSKKRVPFEEGPLPNMATLPIFTGQFPEPANIEVLMGYQAKGGTKVYSPTPIKLTIAE